MQASRYVLPVLRQWVWVLPIVIYWLASLHIYFASLALNHAYRRLETALPAVTEILLTVARYRGPFVAAVVLTVVTISCRIWCHKYYRECIIACLAVLSVYLSVSLFSYALPFICLCNAWMKW